VTNYILRRLLGAIPLLVFISFVTYAMMALAPGGPVGVLGPRGGMLSPEAIANIKASYGLDKPWYLQYFYWLKELVLHGSLGTSFVDHRPVIEKVWEKLPVTLEMVGLALVLTLLIALPLGLYAGSHRGSLVDAVSSFVGFAFYGVPVFWLSIVLIDLFAVHLRWFPTSGIASLGRSDPLDRLWHLTLPVVAIALTSFVGWMRYQRGAMIEAMQSAYIRTARGKGLAEREVVVKHAFRNALLPTVTLLGLSLPGLVGGAYFVEYVFSVPGVGYLTFSSIFARDYPTIMAITMMTAVLIVAGNLVADIAYAVVDPRIRYD